MRWNIQKIRFLAYTYNGPFEIGQLITVLVKIVSYCSKIV